MNFADRLDAAVREKSSPCLLGLDPHLSLLPEEFSVAADSNAPRADRAAAVGDFLCELLDLCSDRVAIVKPQSAFFELLGPEGASAWERVITHAPAKGSAFLAATATKVSFYVLLRVLFGIFGAAFVFGTLRLHILLLPLSLLAMFSCSLAAIFQKDIKRLLFKWLVPWGRRGRRLCSGRRRLWGDRLCTGRWRCGGMRSRGLSFWSSSLPFRLQLGLCLLRGSRALQFLILQRKRH